MPIDSSNKDEEKLSPDDKEQSLEDMLNALFATHDFFNIIETPAIKGESRFPSVRIRRRLEKFFLWAEENIRQGNSLVLNDERENKHYQPIKKAAADRTDTDDDADDDEKMESVQNVYPNHRKLIARIKNLIYLNHLQKGKKLTSLSEIYPRLLEEHCEKYVYPVTNFLSSVFSSALPWILLAEPVRQLLDHLPIPKVILSHRCFVVGYKDELKEAFRKIMLKIIFKNDPDRTEKERERERERERKRKKNPPSKNLHVFTRATRRIKYKANWFAQIAYGFVNLYESIGNILGVVLSIPLFLIVGLATSIATIWEYAKTHNQLRKKIHACENETKKLNEELHKEWKKERRVPEAFFTLMTGLHEKNEKNKGIGTVYSKSKIADTEPLREVLDFLVGETEAGNANQSTKNEEKKDPHKIALDPAEDKEAFSILIMGLHKKNQKNEGIGTVYSESKIADTAPLKGVLEFLVGDEAAIGSQKVFFTLLTGLHEKNKKNKGIGTAYSKSEIADTAPLKGVLEFLAGKPKAGNATKNKEKKDPYKTAIDPAKDKPEDGAKDNLEHRDKMLQP